MRSRPGGGAHGEPWRKGRHVALPRDAPPLPPDDDKERRGKRGGNGLAQQREAEEKDAKCVRGGAPPHVEAQVGEGGGQVEDGGKRVLLLRDPRDGFHADRMDGEGKRRQERPGHRKAAQRQVEEPGGGPVECEVGQVITRRRISPHAELQPEGAVEDRVVLLGRPGLEPDPPQAAQRVQLRADHMGVVVPDKTGAPHALVDKKGGRHQEEADQPIRGAPGARDGGAAAAG